MNVYDMSQPLVSIEEILKKQLLDGTAMYSTDGGALVENVYDYYSLNDLKALMPIARKILLSNGFRFDTSITLKRFKEVFCITNNIYQFHRMMLGNQCFPGNNYNFSDYIRGNDNDWFFSKEDGLLIKSFRLPELIDYRKEYPAIAQFEDTMDKKRWIKLNDGEVEKVEIDPFTDAKDSLAVWREKNIQDLVAVNNYIFNINKAYIPYLISKMPDFVENLVRTYGYTKEPAFNKYVLEKYQSAGDMLSSNYTNDLSCFGELLFTKNCNKHLEIRKDLLDYIAQHTDSANTKMMAALNYYASDLSENDKDRSIYKKYSLSERRKILAYSSCVCDPYFIKGYYGKNGIPSNIQKPLLAYVLHYDPAAEQEYKLHNYYSLPNLKELINTIKTAGWMDGPW